VYLFHLSLLPGRGRCGELLGFEQVLVVPLPVVAVKVSYAESQPHCQFCGLRRDFVRWKERSGNRISDCSAALNELLP